MKRGSRFARFLEPASTSPNSPSPCSCIQAATAPWLREGNAGVAEAEDVVVVMVSVEGAPLAPGVTALGENLQVAFAGSPLQFRLTSLENDPPTGETLNV